MIQVKAPMESKEYLGDGVYVELVAGDIWACLLTTEDGVRTTNRIYLEAKVLQQLLAFAKARGFRESDKY